MDERGDRAVSKTTCIFNMVGSTNCKKKETRRKHQVLEDLVINVLLKMCSEDWTIKDSKIVQPT